MAKPLDLQGNRYGHLVVLERAENTKKGNTQWLCRCDCGNTKIALGYDLTHGRITTCGCAFNKKGKPSSSRVDLVGKKFGKLTVTSLNEEKSKNGVLIWNCRCDCGNTFTARGSNLKSGKAKHCGCSPKEHSNNFIDLTGQRYGMLCVLGEGEKIKHSSEWICKCDCGQITKKKSYDLRSGKAKNCGCVFKAKKIEWEKKRKQKEKEREERNKNRKQKAPIKRKSLERHGMTNTRLYKEWHSMKIRVKSSYHDHKSYYDLGITVCEEWKSFTNFMNWALENGYDDTLTLDRIDYNGNYEPSNCRWADWKTQQNNKRNNVYYTIDGITRTMKEWSEYYDVPYGTVKARRRRGYSLDRLFEPVNNKSK